MCRVWQKQCELAVSVGMGLCSRWCTACNLDGTANPEYTPNHPVLPMEVMVNKGRMEDVTDDEEDSGGTSATQTGV